jgi:hypothetical protein
MAACPGKVANVMINSMAFVAGSTDQKVLLTAIQEGKWDAAFAVRKDPDLGFDFKDSPFGEDIFDYFPYPTGWRYQDAFTGFVFVKPLRAHRMSSGVPQLLDLAPPALSEFVARLRLAGPDQTDDEMAKAVRDLAMVKIFNYDDLASACQSSSDYARKIEQWLECHSHAAKIVAVPRERLQGDLTDEEIATKVARGFFEALIAGDYDKAGLMYSGLTAERAKELFGPMKILRIVETGKPTPGAVNHSLAVPVKVEWEIKGLKKIDSDSPTVRITDVERATKAVREFYEAAIAQDDAKAFRIFEEAGIAEIGLKAEDVKNLKETLAQHYVKFVRIVEIGKPVSDPESGTTEVPVKIELEINMPNQVREFSPNVRPCEGQPDRWEICGGI